MKSKQFHEEYYKCFECDRNIEEKEISNKWKCPNCNNLLRILVKAEQNRVFTRQSGEEIKIGDLVDIPGSNDDYHVVLNNSKSSTISKIALKNYGVVKLNENDWLNCIQGSWDGNVENL